MEGIERAALKHITIHKIDSEWELAIRHRELQSVLCDHLEGWNGVGCARERA